MNQEEDTSTSGSPQQNMILTVVFCVSLGLIGFYAAFALAPLAAEQLMEGRMWIGLPGAAIISGTAIGSAVCTPLMVRFGRRIGLFIGWFMGAFGGALAVYSVMIESFLLLIVGMLILGHGQGSNYLARYAAAEGYPPDERGKILGFVLWTGTVGAVIGPLLLEPGDLLTARLGLGEHTGGLFIASCSFFLAGLLMMVFFPQKIDGKEGSGEITTMIPWDQLSWSSTSFGTISALVISQFVMILIMTMTPVHVQDYSHGLTGVGIVMSVHVLGMFGFAPVVGWLVDRYHTYVVVFGGLVILGCSGMATAVVPMDSIILLTLALFLLGLGWSAAFVGSSKFLANQDARLQGFAETLGWASAGLASVLSGMLMSWIGYFGLSLVGVGVSLFGIVVFIKNRRGVVATAVEA